MSAAHKPPYEALYEAPTRALRYHSGTRALKNHLDGVRRARPAGPNSGSVPWYVPEGAEFDAEQAVGWTGIDARVFRGGDNPWAFVTDPVHDMLERERHLADPHPDELEDWDLGPRRAPLRPVAGEFNDLAALFIPDAKVQALIDEAERLFGSSGDKVQYGEGPAPRTSAPKRRRARRVRRDLRLPPSPPPPRKTDEYPASGRDGVPATDPECRSCALNPAEDGLEGYCIDCADWMTAPVVRLEVEPEPEPELPESDYAAAMRRIWGAPR